MKISRSVKTSSRSTGRSHVIRVAGERGEQDQAAPAAAAVAWASIDEERKTTHGFSMTSSSRCTSGCAPILDVVDEGVAGEIALGQGSTMSAQQIALRGVEEETKGAEPAHMKALVDRRISAGEVTSSIRGLDDRALSRADSAPVRGRKAGHSNAASVLCPPGATAMSMPSRKRAVGRRF